MSTVLAVYKGHGIIHLEKQDFDSKQHTTETQATPLSTFQQENFNMFNINKSATVNHAAKITEIRGFFQNALKPQVKNVEIMAHLLGLKISKNVQKDHQALLSKACIVSLDLEWWEFDSQYMTEIGIATLPQCETMAEPLLKELEVHHLRVKENAHLVNGKLCAGHPESFQFGKTAFVSKIEASMALKSIFAQHDEEDNLVPIILLGHAVDNDIEVLRDSFGFDLNALGTLVMVLDTQVMATELGLLGGKKLSLKNVLEQYSIEEPFLHNAGNDAAQTMVAASLLAMEHETRKGRYDERNQVDVNNLKLRLCKEPSLYWGDWLFCTSCESLGHLASSCPEKFSCDRCNNAPGRVGMPQGLHPTAKCPLTRSPCPTCLQSDEIWRKEWAYSHTAQNCGDKRKSYVPTKGPAK